MNITNENISTMSSMLSITDLIVFAAMLSASAILGCVFGCTKQTTSEYLMGGRTMGIMPISFSLVASSISGITVLGVPSEIYKYGMQYWLIVITIFLVSITASILYIPIYTELKLDSCYQYLSLRFNKKVRRFVSLMYVIFQILVIPIVIYVPSLAFSLVSGINLHLITPVTCIVCIFYTTLGGLKAVVWADTLQTILMFIATIAVLFIGIHQVGSFTEVWHRNKIGGRLEFFNMNPDPFQRHTFWTMMIGTFFLDVGRFVTNQGMVQRILAVPTLSDARWCLFWYSIGFGLSKAISIVTGMVLYAYYMGCDPLSTKQIQRADQLLPLLVTETTSHLPGLSGLFLAGVFSAALSSMSTSLNALSGVLVDDIFQDRLPKCLTRGKWLRVFSVIVGFACVALVFIVEHLGGVLQVTLSMSGITVGSMLGIYTLGMFFPKATSKGAIYGASAGLILVGSYVLTAQIEIARGRFKHKILPLSTSDCPPNINTTKADDFEINITDLGPTHPLLRLSYLYYAPIGTIIVLIVGLLVSKYSERDKDEPEMCDPRLLSPIIRNRYGYRIPIESEPLNCKE